MCCLLTGCWCCQVSAPAERAPTGWRERAPSNRPSPRLPQKQHLTSTPRPSCPSPRACLGRRRGSGTWSPTMQWSGSVQARRAAARCQRARAETSAKTSLNPPRARAAPTGEPEIEKKKNFKPGLDDGARVQPARYRCGGLVRCLVYRPRTHHYQNRESTRARGSDARPWELESNPPSTKPSDVGAHASCTKFNRAITGTGVVAR